MAEHKQIQAIDKASVAKICSGQVIIDLATAVKELVENSLDAGATSVEVKLKEHGLQLIEVADNGRGVQSQDYENLALKYHTSKLTQFSDLEGSHAFFGFRGEALSSLAALSELSIVTRTAEQAAAARLEFDKQGRLVNSTACARAVGTTVAIKELFATLPVRRRELTRNVRREVAKLRLLLQQYAILAGQAQLFASDHAGKSARVVLVSTSNTGPGLRERVSAVLGAKVAAVLQPIEFAVGSAGVKVTGLVSRAGCGVKGEKLRQFCCVNGRPVELPRAVRLLNETYKSLYSSMVGLKPMAFLQFELPAGTFDINVTPDKRTVFMQTEGAIMAALGQALQALWEPSRYSYTVNSSGELIDTKRQAPTAALTAAAADDDDTDDDDEDDGDSSDDDADSDCAVQQQQQRRARQQRRSSRTDPAALAAAAAPSGLAAFMMGATPAAAAAVATAGLHSASGVQGPDIPAPAAATATSVDKLAIQRPSKRTMEAAAPEGAAASQGRSVRARRSSVSAAGASDAEAAAGQLEQDMSDADDDEGGVEEQPDSQQQQQQCDSGEDEADVLGADEEKLDVCQVQEQAQAAGYSGKRGALGTWQQQQRRQQRQQPPAGISLAAFSLHGAGSGVGPVLTRCQQQQQQQLSIAVKQQSLAACGFQITVLEAPNKKLLQQQQQQQPPQHLQDEFRSTVNLQRQQQQGQQQANEDHVPLDSSEAADAGEPQTEPYSPADLEATGGGSSRQKTPAATAAAAAGGGGGAAAAADVECELHDENAVDVVVVDDDANDAPQIGEDNVLPQQQQQQQDQDTGPPLLLQYSIQQLTADVQLRMRQEEQQRRQQQQQQQQVDSMKLVAASLQGDATTAAEEAASDIEGGSAVVAAAAAAAAASVNDAATTELSRLFDKQDFSVMVPLGQFNLGFIIARLRQDLFVIDQHAADEKSTFERLMVNYTVNRQPLLQPRRLTTLTHMDQQVIRENMEVFRRNGFEFVEQRQQQQQQQHVPLPDGSPSTVAQAELRCCTPSSQLDNSSHGDVTDGDAGDEGDGELLLSAVPLVKGSGASGVLGEEALAELLALLTAGERRPEDLWPKRVHDMLASRACRTSIMIGSPLTRQQQARIIARLAQLHAPWNCPHGRPTMRHLAVLPSTRCSAPAGDRTPRRIIN